MHAIPRSRFRFSSGLLASLLLLAAPAPARAQAAQRGHEPWALRSVLDSHTHVLVLALAPDFWAAYDTRRSSLQRVWKDGVAFQGPVYDMAHGPQPESRGNAYLVSPHAKPWRAESAAGRSTPAVRYRGHRFDGSRVTLLSELEWPGARVRVSESPELVRDGVHPGLERVFTTEGVPAGARVGLRIHLNSLRQDAPYQTDGRFERTLDWGEEGLDGLLWLASNGETRFTAWFQPEPAVEERGVAASAPEGPRPRGLELIEASDCLVCHNPEARTVGPAFREIAQRYPGSEAEIERLSRRVLEGGPGAWGDVAMTPHPDLSQADAREMVGYILSLAEASPADGDPSQSRTANPFARWVMRSYFGVTRGLSKLTGGRLGRPHPLYGLLKGVHPSFDLETIRPPGFEAKVGGLGVLPDGRVVLSTWDAQGAVYVLDGLGGGRKGIRARKIAAGLLEPLGLAVVDGEIYVLQKHELTRLVDRDGDGVTDLYETVANGWDCSPNFHEFAFGLAYRDGYFYATLAAAVLPGGKSARHQLPDRGAVLRISREDGSSRVVARGLRTPNGIGLARGGELFVTDNQGDWLPASKLVHVTPDAFFGSRAVDPEGTAQLPVTLPVVWLPHGEIGNSPSQPVGLELGPYRGQLLHGDVYHGGIKRVFVEEVAGRLQGAVFRFSQGLEAGVNRLAWGPDGRLYVGGIGNPGDWGQPGKLWFGLQRLSYAGRPTFEMLAVRALPDGVEIELTLPLQPGRGEAPDDYAVSQWRYEPTADYGGPKLDLRELEIRGVRVSQDRRRVTLALAGMAPGHVLHVRITSRLRSAEGHRLWSGEAWYTLNRIPPARVTVLTGDAPAPEPEPAPPNTLTRAEELAGWELLFDGESLAGWRAFRGGAPGANWQVMDGTLAVVPGSLTRKLPGLVRAVISYASGGDILTENEYEDFELSLEWKISPGGNSGIFYNAVDTGLTAFELAPEMQVLDNDGHPDGSLDKRRAGDLYDLVAGVRDATLPVGSWNRVRITRRGGHVEHWMNGHKLLEIEIGSPEWKQRLSESKFRDEPGFGLAPRGRIGLQDHGDPVWFRNLKIRRLEGRP